MKTEITRYTDEWGEWEIPAPGIRLLIKPSQKWLDENKEEPDTTSPAPDPDEITAEEALAILLGGEDA